MKVTATLVLLCVVGIGIAMGANLGSTTSPDNAKASACTNCCPDGGCCCESGICTCEGCKCDCCDEGSNGCSAGCCADKATVAVSTNKVTCSKGHQEAAHDHQAQHEHHEHETTGKSTK